MRGGHGPRTLERVTPIASPIDDRRTLTRVEPAGRPAAAPVDWRALYDELGERVFRLLHRMTGEEQQAADLTHDAFVRVHECRAQYDGRGSLHAWVFRIAANIGRDALRSRKLRGGLDAELEGAAAGRSASPPDHGLRIDLERALETVGEEHRVVLLLHDVDGYAHREIAEMLDVAVGTSKARLSRARAMLREAMRRGIQ